MRTPKVNKALLPFKILYFLKNGGSSFLPFIAPMAAQRGISPEGIGMIWTMNPLFNSVNNIACGTLADAFKLHRALLQTTCALLAVSFTAFFFFPAITQQPSTATNTSISLQCGETGSFFIVCSANETSLFVSGELYPLCNVNQTYFEKEPIEECDLECKFVPATQEEMSFLQKNISLQETFNIIRQNMCTEGKCFVFRNDDMTRALLHTNRIECGKQFHLSCEVQCEGNEQLKYFPLSYLIKTTEFWLNALCIVLIHVAVDSSSSLIDTMCFSVLGKNRHRYGQTRLFGALGWGMMGVAMGFLVNLFSKGQTETNYTPALVITASFLFLNLLYTTRINVEIPGKRSEAGVGKILLSFPCITLMATALIMGATMAVVWAFEFIYIQQVAIEWDPNFSDSSLLLGLIVWIDCFLGEVTFMFFSGYIIKKLSNVHTFSVTLTATSVRILLYSAISNPWIFLPVHLLHGLSFGVFFANMTSFANLLAPKGAQATMQSIAMACLTVGRCAGSYGGGMMLESLGGSKTFLMMGLFISIYTIIYIIVNCVVYRCSGNFVQGEESGEHSNARDKIEETECGDGQICVQDNEEIAFDINNHKNEDAASLKMFIKADKSNQ